MSKQVLEVMAASELKDREFVVFEALANTMEAMREDIHKLTLNVSVQTESVKGLTKTMEIEVGEIRSRFNEITALVVKQSTEIEENREKMNSQYNEFLLFKNTVETAANSYSKVVKIIWLMFGTILVGQILPLIKHFIQ